ncbi:arsenate reductase [Staphylococcus simulans]|uniref:arsenate reductase family protein n=1 Tax=Staphylococcus simulans TaxID=1286 RepID=UPI000D1E890E|nr:arsenate reductase family protein [Staphylococcus simulans]PTI96375.1 arsenate reductase [Staphylococcus simulans]PTJ50006.1 arsenate reductase [Staphylococcus simulans]
MIRFYQYQNCTTCKKAAKFLDEYGVSYEPIEIVELNPNKRELQDIIDKTGVEIDKLFNKRGGKYRELGLKDRLDSLSDDEKLDLLASDGMLVKRPLAVSGNKITLGFNEKEYKDTWVN